MRACHAADPGSIPGRTSFLGEVFWVFFLACKTNVRKLLDPQGPRISFGRHNHSLIFALLRMNGSEDGVSRLSCLCCLAGGPDIIELIPHPKRSSTSLCGQKSMYVIQS